MQSRSGEQEEFGFVRRRLWRRLFFSVSSMPLLQASVSGVEQTGEHEAKGAQRKRVETRPGGFCARLHETDRYAIAYDRRLRGRAGCA